MRRTLTGLAALATLGIASVSAGAQETQPATFPDFLELDGSASIYLLPDPEFSVLEGGTIEFWVEPDWTETPDFDPVILSAAGPDGPAYVIAMLREKEGIGLLTGDEEALWAFDFDDGQVHHVALNFYDGGVVAIVNGESLGLAEIEMADLAPSGVWIGSADGNTAPFVGAIASLRIWGVPVEPEVLDAFRYFDVLAPETESHPDIDYLQVISDFNNSDVLVVEALGSEEG
jgi:hypothetical protein